MHGILYAHRITDNKMAGSALRNLRVLEKLLDPDAFKNLVFVTNMWDSQPNPQHVKFEQELVTNPKYCKSTIANGAHVGVDYRICEDASESQVQERLSDLFLSSSPVTIQIQRDVVDNKSALWTTTTGRFVYEEVKTIMKGLKELVNELKVELAALSGGEEVRKKRIALEREETEKNYEQAKKQEGILELTLEAIRAHPYWSGLIALLIIGATGALVLGSGKVMVAAKFTGAANLVASGTGITTVITASPMAETLTATGAVNAAVSLGAWGVAAAVGWVVALMRVLKQNSNKDNVV
ncbi:hypothetical protein B0J17DRAFT_104428 [Rhizoctonia solani]|nr:hypothetical protein B0J17DRAFT_104428 [Rhizoctonia solani]